VRTHWEAGKYEKFPTPPPQNIKGKKARHLECMLMPSRWLQQISLPKKLGHHFGHGLTPLAKNTLPIQCWGTFDLKKSTAQFFKHFRSTKLLILDISKP